MALQLIQLALVNLRRPKPICAGAADARAFTRLLFASMNATIYEHEIKQLHDFII